MKIDSSWIEDQADRLFYDMVERRYVVVGQVSTFTDNNASNSGYKGADVVVKAELEKPGPEDDLPVQYAMAKTPTNWNPSYVRPELDTEIIFHAEYMERILSGHYLPRGRLGLTVTGQRELSRFTSEGKNIASEQT